MEWIKRRGRIRIQQRFPQSNLADLAYRQILPLVPRVTKTGFPVPRLEVIAKSPISPLSPTSKRVSQYVKCSLLCPVSLMPRNRTPVVTGRPLPSEKKFGIVASATVNGLNGFEIGTLIPAGLKPTLVPGILNASGTNGTAARDESKNERTSLKSANTVRYFSHISRTKEP